MVAYWIEKASPGSAQKTLKRALGAGARAKVEHTAELGGWFAKLIAFLLVISGLWALFDQVVSHYLEGFPDVEPEYELYSPPSPLSFAIANKSNVLEMRDVKLGCVELSQTLEMPNGAHFIIKAGELRPGWDAKSIVSLGPGEKASFACDPTLEKTPATAGGKVMRRLAAELRIDASYEVHLSFFSWWRINYLSPTFYCKHTEKSLRCSKNREVELDLP
jgi:hypothetical protein